MNHVNGCDHSNCSSGHAHSSIFQTFSEMDWERGLWFAAFTGDKEKVEYLVERARNAREYVNMPDNSGYMALHYSARSGHSNICNMLLRYGADINARTRSGKATPLHKAATAGKLETVKELLQSGADINILDADGQTVLHKAVVSDNNDLINYLLETYPQLGEIKDARGHAALDPAD